MGVTDRGMSGWPQRTLLRRLCGGWAPRSGAICIKAPDVKVGGRVERGIRAVRHGRPGLQPIGTVPQRDHHAGGDPDEPRERHTGEEPPQQP